MEHIRTFSVYSPTCKVIGTVCCDVPCPMNSLLTAVILIEGMHGRVGILSSWMYDMVMY